MCLISVAQTPKVLDNPFINNFLFHCKECVATATAPTQACSLMNMAPLFSYWKCKSTEGAVSYVSCGGLVTSALQNSGQVRRRASRPDNSFLFCGEPSNFAALWDGCVGLIFIFWYFSRRKQQHWLRCIRVHRRLARSERCTSVGVCHHGSDAVASGSAS